MEHDETSKLADVQTKPADLLVSHLCKLRTFEKKFYCSLTLKNGRI